MSVSLPAGFAVLEPFVSQWAIGGSAARAEQRGRSSKEQREAFYVAASAHLGAALDHLDARGLHEFDQADDRLMNVMLSLAHVALAEELQKDAEATHATFRKFMEITRTPAGA